jgi:hypothetical protein
MHTLESIRTLIRPAPLLEAPNVKTVAKGPPWVPFEAKSFYEKAGECQDGFVLLTRWFLPLSQAASVAILPSALFVSDFRSRGA